MSHDMNDIDPSLNPLNPAYSANHNYLEEIFKQEIQGQVQAIKDELNKMKGGHINWFAAQLLLNKLNSISDELKNNQLMHQEDLNSIAADLAALIADINNMEAQGGKNGKVTDAMKALAKKFANDFNKFSTDVKTFLLDARNGANKKVWNQGDFPKSIAAIFEMISGQPVLGPDGKTDSIGNAVTDALKSGDFSHLAGLLQHLANNNYDNKKNPNDFNKENDAFDQWLNGGSPWVSANGIDNFNNIILAGSIADNNADIQRDGELINSDVSAATNFVTNLSQLFGGIVNNQIARG